MNIPTEPIGSIPRTDALLTAMSDLAGGRLSPRGFDEACETAVRDTVAELEKTGSPVITDGEQCKPSFATYPIAGLPNIVPGGVTIAFADGHTRQLPKLASGPFRYAVYADTYLRRARRHTALPVKQAVISASALSLLYPAGGLSGYPVEAFTTDLLRENETDIRRCLQAGAHKVQIDFTEGRLALKLDPGGALLRSFIDLNNRVLGRFSADDRARIGVHTCPGGDCDSTHSADVDYADLLPQLFALEAGNFYIQLASERDPDKVLRLIRDHAKPTQRIFVGVTDPINPVVESPEQVRERTLRAADYIPLDRLGTTDDCGFAPFGDDRSTSRDTALGKIRARVLGTALAAQRLR